MACTQQKGRLNRSNLFEQLMASHKTVSAFLTISVLLLLLISHSSSSDDGHPFKADSISNSQKVKLSLYYEALCPYCADFIVNNVSKIFENGLLSIIDLKLLPWGNAYVKDNNNWVCQHGPDECLLNTVEACAIRAWPDQGAQLSFRFIKCVERLHLENKHTDWKSCFRIEGLNPKPVVDCFNSGLGFQLERGYADETARLNPPHRFVPWVVVDNISLQEDYPNFASYVCKAYKGPVKPKACSSPLLEISSLSKPTDQVCYASDAKNIVGSEPPKASLTKNLAGPERPKASISTRKLAEPEPPPKALSTRNLARPELLASISTRKLAGPEPPPKVSSTRKLAGLESPPKASSTRKLVGPEPPPKVSSPKVSSTRKLVEPEPPPKVSLTRKLVGSEPPPKASSTRKLAGLEPSPKVSSTRKLAEPELPPKASSTRKLAEPKPPPKASSTRKLAGPEPPPKVSSTRKLAEPEPPPKASSTRKLAGPEPPPQVSSTKKPAGSEPLPKASSTRKLAEPEPPPKASSTRKLAEPEPPKAPSTINIAGTETKPEPPNASSTAQMKPETSA